MNKLFVKIGLVMMLYGPPAFSHSSGEHSGSLLLQVMHFIQSAEHLNIMLLTGIVVGLLIRNKKKNRIK